MAPITPCLWFDGNAAEAAEHYISIFPNSRRTDGGEGDDSAVMVAFELDGNPFLGLNGGPQFSFTPAVSFTVSCRDQAEVDYYWQRLGEGGAESRCGWLSDRFGLSWQIVPTRLGELMSDPDPERRNRVFQAMLQMSKIDIAALEAAAG